MLPTTLPLMQTHVCDHPNGPVELSNREHASGTRTQTAVGTGAGEVGKSVGRSPALENCWGHRKDAPSGVTEHLVAQPWLSKRAPRQVGLDVDVLPHSLLAVQP